MTCQPVYLTALGIVSAMGVGKERTRATLFEGAPAHMVPRDGYLPDRSVIVGAVPGDLPAPPDRAMDFDSRNNRMLWVASQEIGAEIDGALIRYGAGRIAVVLGTSTSGINEGMAAYSAFLTQGSLPSGYSYHRQEIGDPALFLRRALGLTGPAQVVSTACSSSAKALSSAARLLAANLCDAVLVGGADSLCPFTLAGFNALDLLSRELCRPMSANRDGINIGEGAALFLMTREPDGSTPVALLGVGETSDAHHPNAPHPEGRGAIAAMERALERAGLSPSDIAYLNLHGTATALNDAMEAKAVAAVLGPSVPVGSTKPLTGHTLGAAGAIEAAILWLSLSEMARGAPLPRHSWDGARDETLPGLALVETDGVRLPPRERLAMMSNSFAFGGSNVSVILGRGWTGSRRAMTKPPFPLPIADFIPHGPPMRLVDRILDASPVAMTTEVTVTRDSLFFVPGKGVPSYAIVEYIAQSVSAFNCWRERQVDPVATPRVGFLLGSRQVNLPIAWFPEGITLRITVTEIFQDGRMGVHEGTVTGPGLPPITTRINVYLPESEASGVPEGPPSRKDQP